MSASTTTVSTIGSCRLNNYPRLLARQGHQRVAALMFSSSKYGFRLKDQLSSVHRIRHNRLQCKSSTANTDGTVRGSTATSGPPSSSWRNWILGTLLSIILPFWKHKWAPLLALKKEVDHVVDTIDTVIEVVENVAGGVERMADEVAERLPEGGKLQEVVCMVEKVAKKIHEDAHATDQFIHKVEDVEKDLEKGVETIVESMSENENEEIIKKAELVEEEEVVAAVEMEKVEGANEHENVESKKAIDDSNNENYNQ